MRFDQHFVRGVIPLACYMAETFPDDVQFCIDSRLIEQGDIFVALLGEVTDGHYYIQEAFAKGAAGILMRADKKDILASLDPKIYQDKLVMLVPDTLQAFLALAKAWRNQFSYPVIGITGSVGKTSTKEILSSIFTAAHKPHTASRGNQNTLLGIALTMLRMRPEHEAAIFEIGINKRGEMVQLVDFLQPTNGIITYIGHAHMEGLGILADIAAEKRNLFAYFAEHNIGVINGDQALLTEVAYHHPVVKFGTKTSNQVQARKIVIEGSTTHFILKLYKNKYQVTLPIPHTGMVYNILAAAAMAYTLRVPENSIVESINQPIRVAGRFEYKKLRGGRGLLINDCYNANPESMKAALTAFGAIDTPAQKIAILGDMLELGAHAPFWHRQVGRVVRQLPKLDRIILVGNLVKWTQKTVPVGVKVDFVPSWKEAVSILDDALAHQNALVLVKGSFGMHLDNLVVETTEM